jgi:oxygen-dependent protoporphyrinogen oxidase
MVTVAQRVVVVGGGIAGLAAAHRLRELAPATEVVVLERSDRLGGKIHTAPFAGQPIETGAETFLMRDARAPSAALELAHRVGLGDALLHPAPVPAALALEGELRPIPGGTLMGIPADPASVSAVAPVEDRDADEGRPLLDAGEDVAVGALVRARLGDAVVARLVDPLLGGVYAGRADELSLQATVPGLHRAAQEEHTLAASVQAAIRAAARPTTPGGAPIFATVVGGLSRLVETVAQASGAQVRLGTTVRELSRTASGWRVSAGAAGRESHVDADAVVLAVPAAPAARLLSDVDGQVAEAVALVPYASMALVTLALPASTELPELSGFLVPADAGFAVKAATFFTTKWPHLRGDHILVRASLGRHGDRDVLGLTDESLIDVVCAELPALLGRPLPAPLAARVNRWGGGLPQYGVGHVKRTAWVRSVLPASLALAGAAYDGVGIAACVRSGEAAADRVSGL